MCVDKNDKGDMAGKAYSHSAYWYAKKYGWTYSEARSYTGQYLDIALNSRAGSHRGKKRGFLRSTLSFARPSLSGLNKPLGINPLLLGVCMAMDIGVAVKSGIEKIKSPSKRAKIKRTLKKELAKLRRPMYYERETRRRRLLAQERRKITRRTTVSPCPTPEELLEAWNKRKESKENMIILGGILHDLECYVDNHLKIDEYGNIKGRNRGIKGWLKTLVPELAVKYKTLMRYKAMAVKLRQATRTSDPEPTKRLLEEPARDPVVAEILSDERVTFSSILQKLEVYLSPEKVLDGHAPH